MWESRCTSLLVARHSELASDGHDTVLRLIGKWLCALSCYLSDGTWRVTGSGSQANIVHVCVAIAMEEVFKCPPKNVS